MIRPAGYKCCPAGWVYAGVQTVSSSGRGGGGVRRFVAMSQVGNVFFPTCNSEYVVISVIFKNLDFFVSFIFLISDF